MDAADRTDIQKPGLADLFNLLMELKTQMTAGFKRCDDKFAALERRLDSIERRLDSLEGRVTALEGRVTALEGRMTALEGRVTGLEADAAPSAQSEESKVPPRAQSQVTPPSAQFQVPYHTQSKPKAPVLRSSSSKK